VLNKNKMLFAQLFQYSFSIYFYMKSVNIHLYIFNFKLFSGTRLNNTHILDNRQYEINLLCMLISWILFLFIIIIYRIFLSYDSHLHVERLFSQKCSHLHKFVIVIPREEKFFINSVIKCVVPKCFIFHFLQSCLN